MLRSAFGCATIAVRYSEPQIAAKLPERAAELRNLIDQPASSLRRTAEVEAGTPAIDRVNAEARRTVQARTGRGHFAECLREPLRGSSSAGDSEVLRVSATRVENLRRQALGITAIGSRRTW